MGRILVVANDELARFTTAEILTDAGHQVTKTDFADAASSLREGEEAFDLLVVDELRRGANGRDIIENFNGHSPSAPVLAISNGGFGGESASSKSVLGADATEVLTRPFSVEDLLAKIDRCLKEGG